jgi:acyl-CoA reductase-like NAD-dependent aldehyde dehydrogenase
MAITVRTLQNFIGGDWVESTGTEVRPIVSPVTGETLAEVPDASAEDIAAAARAARKAQSGWAARSAWERAEICHAIANLIDERHEEMARELTSRMSPNRSRTSRRPRRTSASPPRT